MGVARAIDAHIREAGVINSVGYQGRYGALVDRAREVLAGVPIGLVLAIRLGGLPPKLWWRIQEQSGGMLIEQHTHAVDLMRYLAGEVDSVYAAAGTLLLQEVPQLSIDDVNAATVQFSSGAVGTIVNTCAVAGRQLPNVSGYIHIVARNLVLAISPAALHIMRGREEPEVLRGELEDGNYKMNETFIRAVETGDSSAIRSSYSDSLRTHAVTVGAVQSARTGRPLRIADLLEGRS